MKNKKEIKLYALISVFILALTAVLLVVLWFIKGGDYSLYYDAMGGLLGGLLGGGVTLIALIITTEQTKKIQEENKEETRRIQEENRGYQNELRKHQNLIDALTCMPMLEVNCEPFEFRGGDNKNFKNLQIIQKKYDDEISLILFIKLKNIGKGPCNIYKDTMAYTLTNKEDRNKDIRKDLEEDEENKIEGENTFLLSPGKEKIYQINIIEKGNVKGFCFNPIIYGSLFFYDLLGNKYKQLFTFFCDKNFTTIKNVQVEMPEMIH